MNNPNNIFLPAGCTFVHQAKINRENRSRIDYGDLEELATSIKEHGLLHPPVVSKNKDTGELTLVAGGRRTAALQMLGFDEVPVLFREDLSSLEIAELECEENVKRLNMKWQERALNIAKAHELRKDKAALDSKSWGMRETGRLFGCNFAHVSHCVQLRPYIINEDKQIMEAKSIREAYDILLKRKEDEAVRLSAQSSLQAAKVTEGFNSDMSIDAILNAPSEDCVVIDNLDELLGESPVKGTVFEKQEFELSRMFFLGSCLDIMPKLAKETVDHIVCDPPYGIPIENMDRINNLETIEDTHVVEDNLKLLPEFIRVSYDLLKPNGFLVMWYDLDHHEKIQAWAKQVGYQVQRWPIIWQKLHRTMNNAATKNFTKDFEVAMVMRKGNASLIKPQITSIVAADNSVERKLYDNPFAKPSRVWHFIYEAIAYKGQIVFDPFMGQGSSCRAALDLGLTPMGIEIDENHFNRCIHNVKIKINEITGNKAIFK